MTPEQDYPKWVLDRVNVRKLKDEEKIELIGKITAVYELVPEIEGLLAMKKNSVEYEKAKRKLQPPAKMSWWDRLAAWQVGTS